MFHSLTEDTLVVTLLNVGLALICLAAVAAAAFVLTRELLGRLGRRAEEAEEGDRPGSNVLRMVRPDTSDEDQPAEKSDEKAVPPDG